MLWSYTTSTSFEQHRVGSGLHKKMKHIMHAPCAHQYTLIAYSYWKSIFFSVTLNRHSSIRPQVPRTALNLSLSNHLPAKGTAWPLEAWEDLLEAPQHLKDLVKPLDTPFSPHVLNLWKSQLWKSQKNWISSIEHHCNSYIIKLYIVFIEHPCKSYVQT